MQLYRAYLREEERLRDQGAEIRRLVLEGELKREYQVWLQGGIAAGQTATDDPIATPARSNAGRVSMRHADLLKVVDEWTIRVLLPRRFRKAAALYRYAVRDAFLMPLTPRETEELDWYFRARRGEVVCPARDRDLDLATAARTFGAARFEALYRLWQHRGVHALWTMQSLVLRDQIQRGWAASNSPNSGTSICSSRHSSVVPTGLRTGSTRETT